MMRVVYGLAVCAAFLANAGGPAAGHGPTPQKVLETVMIAAPPEAVWAAVKDFASLSWNPLVASSTGRGGNEPGAERDVVLKSGGRLTDSLDEYRADEMTYSYRLATPNIEAFPVSFYSATLQVRPAGGGASEVEWDARFYRADTGNFPSETQNDQAAIEAMTAFVTQGLAGLKRAIEGP